MTDATQSQVRAGQVMPYTVLLMLPDHMRDDESCAADWIRRVWVDASSPDDAFATAQSNCGEIMGWDEDAQPDPDDLDVIAVYPGHLFDLFHP